ncbi:hypothetical protein KFE25_012791 [Diacronema lutheri]|uniref:Large ribosomal subunit protein uL2m n=2 Tax=Diacronema lutheri TaxID=2081491 RepID=A0A8J6C5R5_DIALT|nr:hypothetical protein KFE25_012791 [Diacronema lutheri]
MLRALALRARPLSARAPFAPWAARLSTAAPPAAANGGRDGGGGGGGAGAALEAIVPSLAPNLGSDSRSLMMDSLRRYNPTSAGTRHRVIVDKRHLWKGPPLRALTVGISRSGGRNNTGRVTVWHRGGGNKRKYRIIDMKRTRYDDPAIVERIEYDPNRSAHIALVRYADGAPAYILAPRGLAPGASVVSAAPDAPDASVEIAPGNCLTLRQLPTGVRVHNLEMRPGRGGQLVRSAGVGASLLAHVDDQYALVRLPSGETRKLLSSCRATIGELSNTVWKHRVLGKAGASRWSGRRPTVRGMAMNPVDHPHGGGNGKSKGGRPSVTPWGWPTKGGWKTRPSKKYSNRLIVTRRPPGVRMRSRK